MHSRNRNITAALLSLVVAGACGSDSSVAPTTQTGGSLTDAVAQLSVPALGAATTLSGLPGGALSSLDATRCAYAATSQSFTCPTVTVSGLTLKQSFTLLDASGGKQSAYGATTSSVHLSSSVTGTVTQGTVSVSVDAQQELTLSGLLTATHTLDGTVTTTLSNVGTAVPALGTVTTTTIDHLVLPASATGASAWPASGTITAVTKTLASGGVPAVTLLTASITFTGSSKAMVSITAAGVSKTCTVDLASQAPSCS